MTQYVYLLQRHGGQGPDVPFDVLEKPVEPKSGDVLNFLDALSEQMGNPVDCNVKLNDGKISRVMRGRLIEAKRITVSVIGGAFEQTPSAKTAVSTILGKIVERPNSLFGKLIPQNDWNTFRELFELRTLVLQGREKKGRFIAICHD